jgi:hypothetical protein
VGVTSVRVIGGPPDWLSDLLRAPCHVGRFLIPILDNRLMALIDVLFSFVVSENTEWYLKIEER